MVPDNRITGAPSDRRLLPGFESVLKDFGTHQLARDFFPQVLEILRRKFNACLYFKLVNLNQMELVFDLPLSNRRRRGGCNAFLLSKRGTYQGKTCEQQDGSSCGHGVRPSESVPPITIPEQQFYAGG
jgi:hypothetical protein